MLPLLAPTLPSGIATSESWSRGTVGGTGIGIRADSGYMMSGDLDTTSPVDAVARSRRQAIGRWLWSGSHVSHVVAIALVLVAISFATRPSDVWTADEGAVRAQVELLHTDGTWSAVRPFASIDPEELLAPIHGASIEGDRYYPYTKQPLLPALLTPLRLLGDGAPIIVWSLVGTMGFAVVVGMSVRRFDERLMNLAMWIAALFTPAFFYGFTVLGHTMAAAACGAMALIAITYGTRATAWWLVAMGCAAFASALRAEAVIYSAAVAVAVMVVGLRTSRRASVSLAAALIVASVGAAAATAAWDASLGGPTPEEGEAVLDAFRFLSGAFSSLILVDFGTPAILIAVLAITGGAGLLTVAIVREPDNAMAHWLFAGVSIAGSVFLLVIGPAQVGGLLSAMPILVCGLLVAPRTLREDPGTKVVLLASSVFAVVVLLTQERGGGGTQWGGRYFLVMVPALLPIALVALAGVVRRSRTVAVPLVVALAIGSSVLAVDAVWVLHSGRQNSAVMASRLSMLGAEVAHDDADEGTVMSTHTQIGRHAWRYLDEVRFLLIPDEYFDRYFDRHAEAADPPFGYFGAVEDRLAALERHDLAAAESERYPYFVIERSDE